MFWLFGCHQLFVNLIPSWLTFRLPPLLFLISPNPYALINGFLSVLLCDPQNHCLAHSVFDVLDLPRSLLVVWSIFFWTRKTSRNKVNSRNHSTRTTPPNQATPGLYVTPCLSHDRIRYIVIFYCIYLSRMMPYSFVSILIYCIYLSGMLSWWVLLFFF